MSDFNPDSFFQQEVTESFSTESIPVPEGVYVGTSRKLGAREFTNSDGNVSTLVELTWVIGGDERTEDGRSIRDVTGRDENFVTQKIWLDKTGQALDTGPGKNVVLGKLREALGQNVPGKPWAFSMLLDHSANVKVKHEVIKSGDREGDIMPRVTAVSKL